MNLTPEEKAVGSDNYYEALGVSRRDFLKEVIAAGAVSGAGLGAMYFGYQKIANPVRIGVIGTQRTIMSNAYRNAIRGFDAGVSVFQKATPLLVPLIEEGWQSHPVMGMVLSEYLKDFKSSSVDTVVLGCTHYPLIKTEIQGLMNGVGVVDSAYTTAQEIVEMMKDAGMLREVRKGKSDMQGIYQIYLTDYTEVFRSMGEKIIGRVLNDLNIITLNWTEGKLGYHFQDMAVRA